MQTFLHRLADIRWVREDGGRLLNVVATFADHEIVQVCLAKGVDVNWEHPNGRTALIAAMWENRSRAPNNSYWLQFSDHINKQDPRTMAVRCAIVEVLLDHGADLNLCANFNDGFRRSPLICAACRGLDLAVEELIRRGVDCNGRIEFIRKPEPRRRRLASAFRRVSAEQEPENMVQSTSDLMCAALTERLSTLRFLLAYGACTSLVDEHGKTALEWASQLGCREIEQLLLEHDEALGRSLR